MTRPPVGPHGKAGRGCPKRRGRIGGGLAASSPAGLSTCGPAAAGGHFDRRGSARAERFVDAVSQSAEAFHQEVTGLGQLHASSGAFSRAGSNHCDT